MRAIGIFLATALAILSPPSWGQERILVINSYSPTFPTTEGCLQGVDEGLAGLDAKIDVEFLYSKAPWSEAYAESSLALLRNRLAHRAAYDLIISMDDHALDVLALDAGRSLSAPIVAVGVNHPDPFERFERTRITGAVELIDIEGTIALADELQGGVNQILLVVDGSQSGEEHRVLAQQAVGDRPVHVLSLADLDAQAVHARLGNLEPDTAVIILSAHIRGSVEVSFATAHQELCTVSSAPCYTPFSFALGSGPVGGSVISMRDHGVLAGRYAVRLLAGDRPDELPIVQGTPAVATVVPEAMQQWKDQLGPAPAWAAPYPPQAPLRWKPWLATIAIVGLGGGAAVGTRRRRRQAAATRTQRGDSLASVGRVASGVAHDLNNLLTVVQGYGSMIEADASVSAQAREDAQNINEASERAARLTKRVLQWAKGQTGEPEVVIVGEHLRELASVLQRAIAPGTLLELDADLDLAAVRMQPVSLDQIVLNLAVNAKEAGARMIEIRVGLVGIKTPRAVLTGSLPRGSWANIQVSDDGSGFEDGVLAKATKEFFSTKGPQSSSGLGLATVRNLVEEAGGFLDLSNREEGGAQASIWLPATDEERAKELRAPLKASRSELFGSASVWVIEDDRPLRELLSRNLRAFGYQVESWSRPDEVLHARDSNQAPAFLLVDFHLQGMNGKELIDELRSGFGPVPALLISGTPEVGANLGVPVMGKPFDVLDVIRAVKAGVAPAPPPPLLGAPPNQPKDSPLN